MYKRETQQQRNISYITTEIILLSLLQTTFVFQEQAKIEYDSKVDVWIPDKEEGFLQGKITKTEGGSVTVKLSNGQEVWVANVFAFMHLPLNVFDCSDDHKKGRNARGEPAEIQQSWRHVKLNIFEWCQRFAQLATAILQYDDLCEHIITVLANTAHWLQSVTLLVISVMKNN